MMAAVVKAHPGVSNSYAHVSKEGIDVSHYQGEINWDAVAGDGKISYAYLKATEGATLVDDTYARNLSEAKRVGLKVGSYHFYRPNTDWRKQLENLSSVVKPGEQDLLPIIDIEHRGKGSDEAFLKTSETLSRRSQRSTARSRYSIRSTTSITVTWPASSKTISG